MTSCIRIKPVTQAGFIIQFGNVPGNVKKELIKGTCTKEIKEQLRRKINDSKNFKWYQIQEHTYIQIIEKSSMALLFTFSPLQTYLPSV